MLNAVRRGKVYDLRNSRVQISAEVEIVRVWEQKSYKD